MTSTQLKSILFTEPGRGASFTDVSLEKLYQFARHLLKLLPASTSRLPVEVQQNIDLQSYRLQQISQGKIVLKRGTKEVQPMQTKDRAFLVIEELEPLSKIIAELNTQFGTDFNENDKVCILAIEERLSQREDLKDSLRVNKPDDAMLTFSHALTEILQSMVETHFKFYKHVTDDKAFAERFVQWLFERYQQQGE